MDFVTVDDTSDIGVGDLGIRQADKIKFEL